MFFLIITSVISHRVNLKLQSGIISTLPDYFHFQKNGNYTVQFKLSSKTNYPIIYDFYICTKKEFSIFIVSRQESICSISQKAIIETNSMTAEATGIITESGAYQFLFYPSGFNENAEVQVQLRNPNSYLDSEMRPCLYSEPIFAGIISAILVFWIINWITCVCYKGSESKCTFTLHEFITITYIVTLLYSICQILELWYLHQNDKITPLTQVSITFRFLQYWVLFSTMLMASKGWCIVHESLSKCSVAQCIIYAIFLAFPLIVMEYMNLGNWGYLVLIFGIIGIFFYYRLMMESVRDATLYVIAHLVVISNEGIDPKTTPVYTKYKMFRRMSWGVISYFLLSFLVSSIATFFDIPYYIEDILQDLISALLLAGAAFIFKLRREMRNGYMIIGDMEENGEPRQFTRDDIRSLSVQQVENMETGEMEEVNGKENKHSGMREWEEGMALPPQPLLIDSNNDDKKEKKTENKKQNQKEEREEELIKDTSVEV